MPLYGSRVFNATYVARANVRVNSRYESITYILCYVFQKIVSQNRLIFLHFLTHDRTLYSSFISKKSECSVHSFSSNCQSKLKIILKEIRKNENSRAKNIYQKTKNTVLTGHSWNVVFKFGGWGLNVVVRTHRTK